MIEVLQDAMCDELATKRDLADLEGRLSRQFSQQSRLIAEQSLRLENKIDLMRAQIATEIAKEIGALRAETQRELNSIKVQLRVLEIMVVALLVRVFWEPLAKILGWSGGP